MGAQVAVKAEIITNSAQLGLKFGLSLKNHFNCDNISIMIQRQGINQETRKYLKMSEIYQWRKNLSILLVVK